MNETNIPDLALLHAIPNGGKRSPRTAARLKAEGVLAGVPDLFLPVSRKGWHGLYIEMKHGRNVPSEAQVNLIRALDRQGYQVLVCYSWEDARNSICHYLGVDIR